jgi:hypothetical protein
MTDYRDAGCGGRTGMPAALLYPLSDLGCPVPVRFRSSGCIASIIISVVLTVVLNLLLRGCAGSPTF